MVDNSRLHTMTPSEAAALVGVGPHSIRRWCEWHAAHLSPGANPGIGGQRRLTMLDVEVLKEVSNLRLQGLQTLAINEQLAGLTFAEIDTDSNNTIDTAIAPQSAPDGLQQAPGVLVALEAMRSEIDAIRAVANEGKRIQRDAIYLIAIGIVIGLLFAVGMILLAWLYSGA